MMRSIARWAGAVVLVLVVAWGGLWWYTESRLHDMLATYAKLQSTSDGLSVVEYDGISNGTNPLAASATIHNLRWSLNTAGTDIPVAVGMAQIKVWIDAFNPLVMHIGLPNRIFVTTPQVTASINFDSIAASAGLDPRALVNRNIYALTSQTLAIHNLDVVAGAANIPLLHVDDINGHETFNPAAGPGQIALAGQDSFDGVTLAPMLVLLGHVPFGGTITHIGFNVTLSGPADWSGLIEKLHGTQISQQARQELLIQAAHHWAAQGGSGKASLILVVGPSTLNANGSVVFDSNAQPSGTADVTADHLDAFTAAITGAYAKLAPNIAQIETELSPYLSATDTGGQVLNVHVVYGKPGIMVNGSRKADMPPIDWNTLENPPSPVAQAPGDGSGAAAPGP